MAAVNSTSMSSADLKLIFNRAAATETPRAKAKPKRKKAAKKQRKEVCILGYAEETRELVHSLDSSVEIWGINMAHMFTKKGANLTRWLQIHPRNWASQGQPATGYWGRPKAHFNFLRKFKGDVVMSYKEPDIPNCKVFPFDRFEKLFGVSYYTSSFAYLMAMAIDEGYDKIYFYGVNLTAIDEYTHQKAGLEFLIGFAKAKGIEVEIPDGSGLLTAPNYGVSTKEGKLQAHVSERLESARDRLHEASANMSIANAIELDTQHWDEFLGEIMKLSVKELEEIKGKTVSKEQLTSLASKIKDTISARFDKRRRVFGKMRSQAKNEYTSAQGRVGVEQHYLSLLGGIDYRAGASPEVFFPNPILATDIDPPEQQAV